jgi:hypothetical protein
VETQFRRFVLADAPGKPQRSARYRLACEPSPPGPRWWRARHGEPLGLTPPPIPILPLIVELPPQQFADLPQSGNLRLQRHSRARSGWSRGGRRRRGVGRRDSRIGGHRRLCPEVKMALFSRTFIRKRVISLATTASVAATSFALAQDPPRTYHVRGAMNQFRIPTWLLNNAQSIDAPPKFIDRPTIGDP